MKYVKMLGVLAIAAAAMMAFAGSASALLTEGPNDPVDTGDILHAHSDNTILTGGIEVSCEESTVEGEFFGNGSTSGTITELAFTDCGVDTVTVLNEGHGGTLSISSAGTVTSSGAEVTVQVHRTVFGFPVTTHCEYVTNNTVIGSLTEGTEAILDVHGTIPKRTTDGACGTSTWEGTYQITEPHTLTVH